MKRSLFVLAVLLLSFGLASADVGFRMEFVGTPIGSALTPGDFQVELYMTNDANQRNGFSIPLMFYGTGSVTNVTWRNVGVLDPAHPEQFGHMGGAMQILNGFAPGFYSGVRFTALNAILADNNGVLPDTVNHTTATTAGGWPAGTPELLVYRWYLNIDGAAWPEDVVAGTFCVDSIKHANPTYDWLWLPPSGPFGGPYCTDFIRPSDQAPSFTNCPSVDQTLQWHQQISIPLTLNDPEGAPIVAASANIGNAVVTNATTVTWSWNPGCADVGSHEITVCGTDAAHTCPTGNECVFTVTVLNTAPVITNCPTEDPQVGVAGTLSFDLNATDANVGDVLTWSTTSEGVSVDPNTGLVTIDGTYFGVAMSDVPAAITVTDCNGDTDVCEFTFDVVAELPFEIVIEKVEGQLQGHYATVDIIKAGGTNEMHGFDFLFAYDASALTAMGAIPGVIFDIPGVYEWEYFTYRFGPFGNCGSACPSGLIRVVGIAEKNDGPNHPNEFIIPDETVLFQLSFLVSNDRTLECQYVPIRFFWMDCGDNAIAYHSAIAEDPLEILTAVSAHVYAFQAIGTYYDITDPNTGYPTYTGFQGYDLCPPEPNKPGAQPFIDFYNGGIDIICSEDIDARGDINLNGIANEIADAVVFTNYFIYGLPAFTINIEGQTAATDVNADGIVLSVADLVYLIRVIVGDALPYPKLSPAGSAYFTLENGAITTDVQLGAALFVFDGQVNVSAGGNFEVLSAVVDGNTRALVYSFEAGAVITGAILNADRMPVSVEAADYYGAVYDVVVVPNTFSMSNYPNPFNPVTTIAMNLPVESDFTVEIFNVAGQKVAEMSGHGVGTVTVDWDASNVASGIYFYRGTANGVSATEKMVLLK